MKSLISESLPHDATIPALAAVNAEGAGAVLERAGIVAKVGQIRILKHFPRHRITLSLETSAGRMVLKAYRPDPAPHIELMQELAARGLASGTPPTAAPLLGFDRSLRFLVFQWLDGARAAEMVRHGGGRRSGELGAAWLRITGSIDIPLGETWGQDRMEREMRTWAEKIDGISPRLGRQASDLVVRLTATYPVPDRYVLCHGSFSHSHVFDMRAGPGVVDWDSYRQAPIELDAGRFLANLSRMVLGRKPAWRTEVEQASQAFRSGIADVTNARAVEWYRAAKQLKIVMHLVTRRRNRWHEQAPVILDDAMLTVHGLI
jgi:Ser/Thr protein kinase RdoA (MazF antagonist)